MRFSRLSVGVVVAALCLPTAGILSVSVAAEASVQTRAGRFVSVSGVSIRVKVSGGKTKTVQLAGRGGIPRSASKVKATVSVSGTAKRTVRVSASGTSWVLRNTGSRRAVVTIKPSGYWQGSGAQSSGGGTISSGGGSSSGGGGPPAEVPVAPSTNGRYDIGTVTVQDIWVNPASGNDANSGASRSQAVRTVGEAWGRIPRNTTLSVGYRIQLVAGTYSPSVLVNYWEDRLGTGQHPIILNAADGAHTVTFTGDINMFNTKYFYLIGVDIKRDADAFHCEQCSYVLIRDSEMTGDLNSGGDLAHETIKVNQSDHLYIEDSNIHGADDNAIDFVAVQYGHVKGNKVHDAEDWCGYAKGGSAYLKIEENEFYDCGTGGFTAGQGTGLEFTTSPWITYEAVDIKVVNNIVHDTYGAGLGVNGGFNILMAYNTIYHVGARSHLIEFVYGSHSCDGDISACQARLNLGGWGVANTSGEARIPNRNVYFYNNVIYNPAGYQTRWQHFEIPAASGGQSADDNLRINGNLIWNGSASMPLGLGGSTGCLNSNPTCNAAQIIANNAINSAQPDLINPASGNFLPSPGGVIVNHAAVAIPDFGWDGPSPSGPIMPSGTNSNSVTVNLVGEARTGWGHPGAY